MAVDPWDAYAQAPRTSEPSPEADPWESYPARGAAAPTSETEVSEVVVSPARPLTRKEYVRGAYRALGSGVLFGFEDRLEALFRTGQISGPEFDAMRKKITGEQAAFAAQHPVTAGALEIGGAVAGLPIAFTKIPAGLSLGAKVARIAGIGGAEGALQGLGKSDELLSPEAAENAFVGGLAGAALAPAAAAAPAVAGHGLGVLNRIFRRPTEEQATRRALEIVSGALQREGKTPAQVEQEIASLRARNIPATVGEAGVPGLSAQVMRTPEGAPLAVQTSSAQQEAGQRVGSQISDVVTRGAKYDITREGLVANLRNNAETMYGAAVSRGEVDDLMVNNILTLPEMSPFWTSAMEVAERKAAVEAAETGTRPVNPLRDYLVARQRDTGILGPDGKPVIITEYVPSGQKVPTVEAIDWFKRGADEYIDRAARQGGMGRNEAKDLRDIVNTMLERVDELVPEYGAARAQFRGDAEVRDAFDFGMGANLPRGAKSVDKMRPAELKLWREGNPATKRKPVSAAESEAAFVGYGNSLQNLIEQNPNANPAEIITPRRLERLRVLARNPAEIDVLEAALAQENKLFSSRKKALTGVSAAVRQAAREDMERGIATGDTELISALLRSGRIPYAAGLTLRILGGARGQPPEVLTKLADIMRRGDPDEVAQTVVDLTRTERAMQEAATKRQALQDKVAIAAGTIPSGEERPGGEVKLLDDSAASEDIPPPPPPPEEQSAAPAEIKAARSVPEDTVWFVSQLSPSDVKALTLVSEASPDPEEMRYVGHVLQNRLNRPDRYADNIYDVVLGGEFDAFKTDQASLAELMQSERFKRAQQIVAEVENRSEDPTNGATHFWAPELARKLGLKRPSWAKGEGIRQGQTVFYRDVD